MIFVTVGTGAWDFSRLIKAMDRIAGKIQEEVVMQVGYTNYQPQNAKYFEFASKEDLEELYKTARLVVSHAGTGSIITTLHNHKPIVVVPRMEKYKELWDDHQLETTKELESEGKIIAVYDVNDLEKALRDVEMNPVSYAEDRQLVTALKKYLDNLA